MTKSETYNKPGQVRALEKQGVNFTLLVFDRWNESAFAGICMANGCERETAERIARELGVCRVRDTTIRPLKDFELFKAACRMVGVHVTEISPL